MHKNVGLLDILEIVQDFEADEDVLFLDREKQVDIMFNYIRVSFRLFGSSRDTMLVCLLDELDIRGYFWLRTGPFPQSTLEEIPK